jgi:hypothetical protein
MGFHDTMRRWFPGAYEKRDMNGPGGAISFTDWAKMFRPGQIVNYGGNLHQAVSLGGSTNGWYYDVNAVVFACEANRMLLFSEARFQFQQLRNGRPGDLFGNADLAILEEPWPGASTGDLLTQAELDVFQYGNSYWVRDDDGFLLRLDPCNVKILTEASTDPIHGWVVGQRLLAYAYETKDARGVRSWVFYEPTEVGHYKPYPDKDNRFLGTSWVSACLQDVEADASITTHKRSTVDEGAKLGIVVSLDAGISPDAFNQFVEAFRANHEGAHNSGRTLFLGGGADVKTVSQTFEDLSIRAVQGAGETRIAACAGVPPVIVGLSEGLASATYSNYSQARRRLVDGTMRPLWRSFAGAMESLIPTPVGARLWYDDRDIPFLREDVTDQAQILATQASTVRQLIDAGYEPDAVVEAVKAGDLSRLAGRHTDLFSVQLQPPGTVAAPDAPKALKAAPAA